MKVYKRISFLVLMVITSASWGYDSSSSSSSCAKPKFTDFNPIEHSHVAVGSSFSFVASANTLPDSINSSDSFFNLLCRNNEARNKQKRI